MISWVIMFGSLISYYLIGLKKKIGFIIGCISSIGGIILFYNNFPLLFMYISFTILNIINYYKWQV